MQDHFASTASNSFISDLIDQSDWAAVMTLALKKNKQLRVHFCPLVFVAGQGVVCWKRFHNSVIRKNVFYALS